MGEYDHLLKHAYRRAPAVYRIYASRLALRHWRVVVARNGRVRAQGDGATLQEAVLRARYFVASVRSMRARIQRRFG